MSKAEIFSCEDMNWPGLNRLFEEMSGKAPQESEGGKRATLFDLPVIQIHTQTCPSCREHLIDLAKQHGITKGVIFDREESNQEI